MLDLVVYLTRRTLLPVNSSVIGIRYLLEIPYPHTIYHNQEYLIWRLFIYYICVQNRFCCFFFYISSINFRSSAEQFSMGIHGLSKVIGDYAPSAVKENEIKNFFGGYIRLWVICGIAACEMLKVKCGMQYAARRWLVNTSYHVTASVPQFNTQQASIARR